MKSRVTWKLIVLTSVLGLALIAGCKSGAKNEESESPNAESPAESADGAEKPPSADAAEPKPSADPVSPGPDAANGESEPDTAPGPANPVAPAVAVDPYSRFVELTGDSTKLAGPFKDHGEVCAHLASVHSNEPGEIECGAEAEVLQSVEHTGDELDRIELLSFEGRGWDHQMVVITLVINGESWVLFSFDLLEMNGTSIADASWAAKLSKQSLELLGRTSVGVTLHYEASTEYKDYDFEDIHEPGFEGSTHTESGQADMVFFATLDDVPRAVISSVVELKSENAGSAGRTVDIAHTRAIEDDVFTVSGADDESLIAGRFPIVSGRALRLTGLEVTGEWIDPRGAPAFVDNGESNYISLGTSRVEDAMADCTAAGSERCGEGRFKRELGSTTAHVKPFTLDASEVSVSDYAGCTADRACNPIDMASCSVFDGTRWVKGGPWTAPPGFESQICVTYAEADTYCKWAGKRLPTEAEWEFMARGRPSQFKGRVYPWGDEFAPIGAQGVRYLSTKDNDIAAAALSAAATPRGHLDMAGGAYEWVDGKPCSHQERSALDDACNGEKGVVRGGSFASDAGGVRATYRRYMAKDARADTNGFRCASDGAEPFATDLGVPASKALDTPASTLAELGEQLRVHGEVELLDEVAMIAVAGLTGVKAVGTAKIRTADETLIGVLFELADGKFVGAVLDSHIAGETADVAIRGVRTLGTADATAAIIVLGAAFTGSPTASAEIAFAVTTEGGTLRAFAEFPLDASTEAGRIFDPDYEFADGLLYIESPRGTIKSVKNLRTEQVFDGVVLSASGVEF